MKTKALVYSSFTKDTWILIAAAFVTILLVLSPLEYSFPFLIIFAGLLLGAIIILLDSPEEFNTVFFLFIIGFLIRILTALFLYFTTFILNKDGGFFIGDGYNYSLNGWKISKLWELGVNVTKSGFVSRFGSLSGTIGNYDFLNAFIYSISGYSPPTLFFINCLAGSITIIMVFIVSKRIFNNKDAALFASILCAFWPSFIIWSSQNLKDPLTNLGIMIFLYLLIRLHRNVKLSSIIFLFLTVIGLNYIRPLILIPLVSAYLIYLFFAINIRIEVKIICIIFTAIVFLYFFKDLFIAYFKFNLLEEIITNRTVKTYGSLAYLPGFRISSPGDILSYLPLGLFAVWFSPFPWQFFSFSYMFAAPEMILWYLFIPFAIKGIYGVLKNRVKISYLLIATIIVFSIFLAICEGNLGTMFRHKTIVIMLTFIFIGFGLYPNIRHAHTIS